MNTGALFEFDTKSLSEDGTFSGYASRFGVTDLGRDVVMPGAFTKTLQQSSKLKMLLQHEPGKPVGVWKSLVEDNIGLKVTGQLVLDTSLGRDTYALLKAGALDGLSIGYVSKKDSFDRAKNVRRLEEIDLFEISIVTFPMLPSATVERVKARSDFSRLVEAINAARAAIH
ncbi:HK97 family phage prohead protease [Bradyrhizobium sp. CCGE-LA001]|uniref:HK97 family phage prohead protease n=1 Tax=Bradyrhizobium sp. CCGE-LA001 TaxID=1223566 RepID=UPI0002AACB39|nr:HK97 family phage prohead protease [Bradyrhizobium sp. CCGE-LA001]AMA58892.1 primosomal replication protein N [Bradyrhizobium sp. CCGE-LA001]